MTKIKGIYDGANIILLEPIALAPRTEVEVVILEQSESVEGAYWEQLQALGLVTQRGSTARSDSISAPIRVSGAPVSQTIVEERR